MVFSLRSNYKKKKQHLDFGKAFVHSRMFTGFRNSGEKVSFALNNNRIKIIIEKVFI